MKKELDKRTLCPCHSGKPYGECCQPYHQGELPDTAVKLMRSRYAAYALSLPDYIIETTHPENSQFSQDAVAWAAKIVEFSKATEFKDLKILEFQEEGVRATVTFVAHLIQNNKDASFTEKSDFEKVKNKWLYKSGQLSRT